jgi:hypothetical protein
VRQVTLAPFHILEAKQNLPRVRHQLAQRTEDLKAHPLRMCPQPLIWQGQAL